MKALEFLETLHGEDERNRATDFDFDRRRDKRADRSGIRWKDIDKLLTCLACLPDYRQASLHVLFLHPDEEGDVALAKEAAR